MTSAADQQQDPELESLLTQQTDDRRLQQINRRMYQSLHSLDAELRREQRIAACQQPSFSAPSLEARSNDKSGTDAGFSNGAGGGGGESSAAGATAGGTGSGAVAMGGGVGDGGVPGAVVDRGGVRGGGAGGRGVVGAGVTAGGLSSGGTVAANTGGGGNGATAQKALAGSDNDVVARRLRRAAEQETNPTLRAKLWKEYMSYRQGTSAK